MLRLNLRKIKCRYCTFFVILYLHLFFTTSNGQSIIQRSQKAKEVLQYMKTEADPCKDFYEFACGKWADNHTLSRPGELITPQSEVEMRANKDLQSFLSQPGQLNEQERKVANFYQSCVHVESTSPLQQMFMKELLKQFGGIPSIPRTNWQDSYDWLGILAQIREQYGLDILISFEKATNLMTMHDEAIYIGEPKTTIIPPENCSAAAMDDKNFHDEGYEALQEEIAKNMQRWLSMSRPDARRFGGDVIRFEFELCKKMRMPEEEDVNELPVSIHRNQINNNGQNRFFGRQKAGEYRRYSVSELNSQFDNNIDFKRYVLLVLNFPNNGYNAQIFIRSQKYLKHMARVVRSTIKPTIANYLMYRVLSEFNFPSDDHPSRRRAYCVQQVQRFFPKITGELYSRRSRRNDLQQEVLEYFGEITKSLDQSLEADWLSVQTRRAARQKLAQFRSRFPIYENLDLNDLRIEQLDYWQKLNVTMQYNARNKNAPLDTIESFDARTKLIPLENTILVGWALLQPPFYAGSYPRAMKYAVLGQRLARELALAFDEQGWRPSLLSKQILDAFSAEGLKTQTECYRTQYSNYLSNNPDEFRDTNRLREIIADSNGLNLAFYAYLNWLKTESNFNFGVLKPETLKNVDFTNTQLFFIHFAQSRCAAKYGEEPPPEFLPLDRHTPERYDVNGPLSNFVEFAREFGCEPGKQMNPDDKCVFY